MDKRAGYQCTFITASLVLTASSIAVGICFFSPWWLQNIGLHPHNETNSSQYSVMINGNPYVSVSRYYPHRGLWAQCGAECIWFWSNDYSIQRNLFTPLKWHIATQVLYFVAGVCTLVCEIYARVQMCCGQRSKVILSLGILVLVSALLQIASFATFGGGAYASYKVISNPTYIVTFYRDLGDQFWNPLATFQWFQFVPYIGWSFWMGVVGAFLSIVSGVFYLITYCGLTCSCCPCCDD